MAKRSKKRLQKSVADSVLQFAEDAWPYFERFILEAVKALPQLTSEPPKKKRAKRRTKRA